MEQSPFTKLMVDNIVKMLAACFGSVMLVTVFTRARACEKTNKETNTNEKKQAG
jgi:hypothetical protein